MRQHVARIMLELLMAAKLFEGIVNNIVLIDFFGLEFTDWEKLVNFCEDYDGLKTVPLPKCFEEPLKLVKFFLVF